MELAEGRWEDPKGQKVQTPSHSWHLKFAQSTFSLKVSSPSPALPLSFPTQDTSPHPNSRRWTLVLVPLAPQPQGPHTEVPWEAHVPALHTGLPGPPNGTTSGSEEHVLRSACCMGGFRCSQSGGRVPSPKAGLQIGSNTHMAHF